MFQGLEGLFALFSASDIAPPEAEVRGSNPLGRAISFSSDL